MAATQNLDEGTHGNITRQMAADIYSDRQHIEDGFKQALAPEGCVYYTKCVCVKCVKGRSDASYQWLRDLVMRGVIPNIIAEDVDAQEKMMWRAEQYPAGETHLNWWRERMIAKRKVPTENELASLMKRVEATHALIESLGSEKVKNAYAYALVEPDLRRIVMADRGLIGGSNMMLLGGGRDVEKDIVVKNVLKPGETHGAVQWVPHGVAELRMVSAVRLTGYDHNGHLQTKAFKSPPFLVLPTEWVNIKLVVDAETDAELPWLARAMNSALYVDRVNNGKKTQEEKAHDDMLWGRLRANEESAARQARLEAKHKGIEKVSGRSADFIVIDDPWFERPYHEGVGGQIAAAIAVSPLAGEAEREDQIMVGRAQRQSMISHDYNCRFWGREYMPLEDRSWK